MNRPQALADVPDPFDPMAGTLQGTGRITFGPSYIAPTDHEVREIADLHQIANFGLNVSILALDLGTKTGYALRRRDGRISHGTADFSPRASWTPGQKWARWRAWLSTLVSENHVTQIAFEDVKRHPLGQVLAAHAYGGFRAMLELVADQHRVTLFPVGVGQIKKHWTGNGVAKKPEMIAQAKARGFHVEDDNNADALAILDLAVARERGAWEAPVRKDKPKTKRAPKAQRSLL